MRWKKRYVAIVDKFSAAPFSLTGEDEAECIYEVEVFKYLGRLQDFQTAIGQSSSKTSVRCGRCGGG